MSVYDKVLYYCGLVGIITTLVIIVVVVMGVWSGGFVAIGKASLGLVVGVGLFVRGYRAKQKAKEEELIRQFNQVFGVSTEQDKQDNNSNQECT